MLSTRKAMANIFVIVGGKNSGKDEIIRAVHDLGGLHAQIITKYTSRSRQEDDGKEIRCNYIFEEDVETGGYKILSQEDDNKKNCDIVYKKNDNYYGIISNEIWKGLRLNKFQVIVASELEAINSLKKNFGSLVKLIYIYGKNDESDLPEFRMFIENFDDFDHVLIYESRKEDLYDQLFRLFRAYE